MLPACSRRSRSRRSAPLDAQPGDRSTTAVSQSMSEGGQPRALGDRTLSFLKKRAALPMGTPPLIALSLPSLTVGEEDAMGDEDARLDDAMRFAAQAATSPRGKHSIHHDAITGQPTHELVATARDPGTEMNSTSIASPTATGAGCDAHAPPPPQIAPQPWAAASPFQQRPFLLPPIVQAQALPLALSSPRTYSN